MLALSILLYFKVILGNKTPNSCIWFRVAVQVSNFNCGWEFVYTCLVLLQGDLTERKGEMISFFTSVFLQLSKLVLALGFISHCPLGCSRCLSQEKCHCFLPEMCRAGSWWLLCSSRIENWPTKIPWDQPLECGSLGQTCTYHCSKILRGMSH